MIIKNFQFTETLEPLEKIEKIIVHHSSRVHMNAEQCHEYHQNVRGWAGIGYNFFIEKDGTIVEGRGNFMGAHAYGHNRNSIGICLTGDFDIEQPTLQQWQAFLPFCKQLMEQYGLTIDQVLGHRELDGVTKTCPGLLMDMVQLRKEIQMYISCSVQNEN